MSSDDVFLFPDHPAEGDRIEFEFKAYAKTLASLALNPDNQTPFTVVIRGEWGRGKTTLLKQTRAIIKKYGTKEAAKERGGRRVKTLWFNAWKYPNDDTVLAGLLDELISEMRQGDLLNQLKVALEERKGWLAGRLLKAAFPWLFGDESPGSRFEGLAAERAFYDSFEELFQQLSFVWMNGWTKSARDNFGKSLALEPKEAAVAVFLDDLDRCREARVLEVIEAINLFLDLPGLCFYLGLDGARLQAILEKADIGDPEHFLEKVVPVAIDLPAVTEAGAEEFLTSLVQAAPAGSPIRTLLEPEVATVARILDRTDPRHMKRMVNDLSLRRGVLASAGHLGDGDEQVPEAAVLSWHLIHEATSDTAWRRLVRDTGHLEKLFRYLDVSGEGEAGSEQREPSPDIEAEYLELFRDADIREHLSRIRDLAKDKPVAFGHLRHLGSPPRPTPPRAPVASPATSSSRFDLSSRSRLWVPLGPGEFQMGSLGGGDDEQPVHEVSLSPFFLSRYPVTNAQYAPFVQTGLGKPPKHWEGGVIPDGKEDHPVVNVSWDDASAFCDWASEHVGLPIRLPTEAEWEYAARGSEGRTYPWGPEEPTDERANFQVHVGDTTPVGAYPKGATPDGILDLAGNVFEWCSDWLGPYGEGHQQDPQGPGEGSDRVIRSGSWNANARYVRAAYRNGYAPEDRYDFVGFRLARGPERKGR